MITTTKKLAAYVAHPLGSGTDRESNRQHAAKWVAWVASWGIAPIADWIILSGEWEETPALREAGLAIDKELVERADVVLLVGGRVSPGMRIEADHAESLNTDVVDLCFLGTLPPRREDFDLHQYLTIDPEVL